jgi:hypothetical protein
MGMAEWPGYGGDGRAGGAASGTSSDPHAVTVSSTRRVEQDIGPKFGLFMT